MNSPRKILAVVPHPDDEVLGCGGTIKRHTLRGDQVFLCIGTKAYTPDWTEEFLAERPNEIEKAGNILGIAKTYFLDFPSVKVDTIPQKEVNDAISKIVKEVRPEIMYIPHGGDLNQDHRIFFGASLVASRPIPGSSVREIYSYEALSETEWGNELTPFVPNAYVDISKEILAKKEAMSCYKSELREFPHPRSLRAIEALAQKRGSEAGMEYAEAFMVIRRLWAGT
ncbi:MAG: PIG-L family deacetylase [Candidatus Wildermuthbacteria bacterium]|nr:PIG-L family deacetylase [Candidatus Wildermuthbacteria bacterium]